MSDSDIKRLLMRSSNAFSGLDPIQTWLVKKRQSELITVIRNIVNISLKPRVLPPCTKGALLKPLTKKPNLDWSNVSNYRAVSNLSFPSKITERPVPSHLSKCFLVNKLNETQRSTFKCAHSTETALFRVKNDIMVSFDHSQAAVVLFFVVVFFLSVCCSSQNWSRCSFFSTGETVLVCQVCFCQVCFSVQDFILWKASFRLFSAFSEESKQKRIEYLDSFPRIDKWQRCVPFWNSPFYLILHQISLQLEKKQESFGRYTKNTANVPFEFR